MIQFHSFASSSAGCSYAITSTVAEGAVVLDAGVGVNDILQFVDFQPSNIAGAIITHAHQDHSKSAHMLAMHGVKVRCSKETKDAIRGWVSGVHLDAWNLRSVPAPPGITYNFGESGWHFKVFEVKHDSPGTVGVFISDGEDKLFYLTDALYCPVAPEGATIVAIEANHDPEIIKRLTRENPEQKARYERTRRNHMSIDTCVETLKRMDLTKCKQIYLLHLSGSTSNEAEFVDRVKRATGIPTAALQS